MKDTDLNLEFKLIRKIFLSTRTVGALSMGLANDGAELHYCYIVEDTVREPETKPYPGNWRDRDVKVWKIPRVTAIPSGRYEIVLENSPKYGPDTLTLKDVPGYSYIRVHSGNTEDDTDGCLIPGYELTDQCTIKPGTTRTAVADLQKLIGGHIKSGGRAFITIINAWPTDVS